MKHMISTRWLAHPNWGGSQFPIILGAHINIFSLSVKILMLIKWSYRFPYLCWLSSLEWSSYLKHSVQSILKTCLFGIHSWNHTIQILLKYRCPNQWSNWIRVVYLITSYSFDHFLDLAARQQLGGTSSRLWARGKCGRSWKNHNTQLEINRESYRRLSQEKHGGHSSVHGSWNPPERSAIWEIGRVWVRHNYQVSISHLLVLWTEIIVLIFISRYTFFLGKNSVGLVLPFLEI